MRSLPGRIILVVVSSRFIVMSQLCRKAAWIPHQNKLRTPKSIFKGKEDPKLASVLFLVARMCGSDTSTIFFLIKQIGSLSK